MEPNPRFWARTRVCVTGGTGFLGYHLVQRLVSLGARVTVLSLPPRADHPLTGQREIEKVYGDIRDRDTVRRALAGRSVVFHTAGIVALAGPVLSQIYSVHIAGTRQVLNGADPDALVVHTSS